MIGSNENIQNTHFCNIILFINEWLNMHSIIKTALKRRLHLPVIQFDSIPIIDC